MVRHQVVTRSAQNCPKSRKTNIAMTLSEHQIEAMLIEELRNLKYVHREDISDRATLEKNFRDHFQSATHKEFLWVRQDGEQR